MEKSIIIEAAELLLAESGKEPSNRAVLKRIGKGSLTDITPVMREWRNERKELEAGNIDMPQAFEVIASSFVSRVWREANIIANNRVAEVKAYCDTEIERFESESDDLLEELEQAALAIDDLKKELQNEQEKTKIITQIERQLAVSEALQSSTNEQLEATKKELSESKTLCSNLAAAEKEALGKLSGALNINSALDAKMNSLVSECELLKKQLAKQESIAIDLSSEAKERNTKIIQLEQQLSIAHEKIAPLAMQNESLKSEIDWRKSEKAALEKEILTLKEAIELQKPKEGKGLDE